MENKLIRNIRKTLINKNEPVSEIEMTSGNYDDDGKLINRPIPTITTNLCEIGSYDNVCYFTVILFSGIFSEKLLEALNVYRNIRIYGFKNFSEDLYPIKSFSYKKFEVVITQDKYLQVQFNYDASAEVAHIIQQYFEINKLFEKMGISVINQRTYKFEK